HERGVSALAFAPDGRTLATASYDNTIKLWDTATWEQRGILKGHQSSIRSVAFSPDGGTVVSASFDGGCDFGTHSFSRRGKSSRRIPESTRASSSPRTAVI